MKKIKDFMSLLLWAFVVLSLVSCDLLNAPLRKHMTEYYNNNDNYFVVQGEVVDMDYHEDVDWLRLIIDIQDNQYDFYYHPNTTCCEFQINAWSTLNCKLNIGDEISFTTASFVFYNGHRYPIVQLRKDNFEYLSFEDGKNEYLSFIAEFGY